MHNYFSYIISSVDLVEQLSQTIEEVKCKQDAEPH